MRVLAVIPARGGSKGVPGKNIKLLGNKPLLQYTAESALESRAITKVILSTDSEEIAKVGIQIGLEVPFIRPSILAQDTTPTIEVLQHAIKFYEDQDVFFDLVCILQPTTPFRQKGFIDKAIEKFSHSNIDTLISVLEVPHQFNPHWVFEEKEKNVLRIATGDEIIIPRRQDLPKSFYRDGSIYLIKKDLIVRDNTLFGKKIGYIESEKNNFVNIDTLDDWLIAEKIIKLNHNNF